MKIEPMFLRRVLDIAIRLIAVAFLAAAVSACADGMSAAKPSVAPGNRDAGGLKSYRLGVGDKVKLVVYGEQDLSGQLEVNAAGDVHVPLVGDIPARGSSVAELKDRVQRKLADGYVKQPKVSVEITSYRPIYVHGEVKNGGEFAFKFGTRLRDAVAMAGGYTYRADQGYALVTREGEGAEMRVSTSGDATLMPGDNIRIPERFF